MNASGDPARPAMREPHCTVTRRAGLARRHGHATIIASVTIAATRARKTVASRSSFANHICVRLHSKCIPPRAASPTRVAIAAPRLSTTSKALRM